MVQSRSEGVQRVQSGPDGDRGSSQGRIESECPDRVGGIQRVGSSQGLRESEGPVRV